MLVDTHAHVNFNAFKDDSDEVIRRSLAEHIMLINIGSQYSTSKRAVEIAEKYPEGVYAAVGLHPIHVEDGFDNEQYRQLAKSKKVAAIGEIGLDYKAEYVLSKEKQKEVLQKQLALAKELNLPVILHCRMAHDELIEILNTRYKILNTRGVVHCFIGDWQQAQAYLGMGFYLGFNGIIFKLDLDEMIQKTPLERILLETDCPYLTPLPAVALAKAGRNEPIYIKYVAEKIAQIKNLSYKEVAEITSQNAQKLFKITALPAGR